jgi:putative transposase
MSGKAIPIFITEKQSELLHSLLRRQKSSQALVRRIQMIFEAANGLSNTEISLKLHLNRESIIRWRKRWAHAFPRLKALENNPLIPEKELLSQIESVFQDAERCGAPPTYKEEQIVQIIAIACEDPQLSEKPFSHWSQQELANEAIRRKIVNFVSPRSVGRFLKRGPVTASSCPLLVKCES